MLSVTTQSILIGFCFIVLITSLHIVLNCIKHLYIRIVNKKNTIVYSIVINIKPLIFVISIFGDDIINKIQAQKLRNKRISPYTILSHNFSFLIFPLILLLIRNYKKTTTQEEDLELLIQYSLIALDTYQTVF